MSEVIDYGHEFPDHLAAQGKGTDFLRLEKLDTTFERADGQKARYALEHRWLSIPCTDPDDEAWCCVEGNEYTYWKPSEIKELLADIDNGEVDLFDHFNLF